MFKDFGAIVLIFTLIFLKLSFAHGHFQMKKQTSEVYVSWKIF